MGLSRRINDRESGLSAVARGLELLEKSGLADTVSGGTTPYTFALASGSSLPSGLNLSGANNATLSGSVATPNTYNFTLTVTDDDL